MGIYEKIKDITNVIQKADNIDLYRQLLDLGKDALDMQEEIANLKTENQQLRDELSLNSRIVRHKGELFITLEGDEDEIHYCSNCWGDRKKLIQLRDDDQCYFCQRDWLNKR